MDCLSASQLRPSDQLAAGPVRGSRFLTADDSGRLTRFYLGFDFEARRCRFGDAVSDDAIIEYCDAIEWRHSVLIARDGAQGLKAVLEIHPLSQQWDCAELIAACPDDDDRLHILAQLLQIAAFSAAQRGCRTFLVPLDDTVREILPLLQGMGRVRLATTQACVDLGATAVSRQSSSLRAKRSNPESNGCRLDCFVASAPRNDEFAYPCDYQCVVDSGL